MEGQEFETLKMVYQEQWNEIRWRRDAEYTVALGVGGFFTVGLGAVAAARRATSSNPAHMPCMVRLLLSVAVVSILAFALLFIWQNHERHQANARHIVKIQEKLNLYEKAASDVSVLDDDWQEWGQPGTGRWGPASYTGILSALAILLCAMILSF